MSEAKRTPGPWVHKAYDTESMYDVKDEVVGADGDVVCCNTPFYPTGITRPDARLIAAAPDMLEVLEWVESTGMMEHGGGGDMIRAAIAKAKGGDGDE